MKKSFCTEVKSELKKLINFTLEEFVAALTIDKPTDLYHSYYSSTKPCYTITNHFTQYTGCSWVEIFAMSWADKRPKLYSFEKLYRELSSQGLHLFWYRLPSVLSEVDRRIECNELSILDLHDDQSEKMFSLLYEHNYLRNLIKLNPVRYSEFNSRVARLESILYNRKETTFQTEPKKQSTDMKKGQQPTVTPIVIKLVPVVSSSIKAIGHDGLHKLHVQFAGGAIYEYIGVPVNEFANFINSDSKGKFLETEIKPNYQFTKL